MMQQASGTEAFARPKFRQDQLVAEAVEDGRDKFIDVMDPDSGTMFRFYESEFSLAVGMDGQRDVPGIISWAREELGMLPTAAEVRAVIAQLGELGYLDLTAAAQAAAVEPAERPSERPVVVRTQTPPPVIPKGPRSEPRAAVKPPVDDELAPGIVVGAQQKGPMPSAGDVELGNAGAIPQEMPIASDTIPSAEIQLGASGTTAPKTPRIPVEDVALGAPGAVPTRAPTPVPVPSDISMDLSSDFAVGRNDVKEAVRASKVMSAVDVPKDLQAILDEPIADVTTQPSGPQKAPVAEAKPQPKPEPKKPEPVAVKPSVQQAKPEPKTDKPAIVAKPVDKPVVAEKQPVKQPTAPTSKTSTRLIILFVLLLAVFGLYMVWKHVLRKSNEDANKTGEVTQPQTPPNQPPIKPEPKPDPIKLATFKADPVEVKAPAAAVVEAVEAATPVKKDAIVIRLAGAKQAQAEVDAAKKDVDRINKELVGLRAELEAARVAANQPKITAAQAKVDASEKSLAPKKEQLDKKLAALDKVVVKAPADGDVAVAAKPGKVNANDALFTLTPAPVLTASFKPDASIKAASSVYVAVKGSETKLTCKVAQSDDKALKVECADGGAAKAGDEVSLAGPAPDEAPAEEPKPADKPADPKPADPTPADKPADPKPAQPVQPKPVQPRPVQPKPVQPKPADPGSAAADPKPADPKPADPPATP